MVVNVLPTNKVKNIKLSTGTCMKKQEKNCYKTYIHHKVITLYCLLQCSKKCLKLCQVIDFSDTTLRKIDFTDIDLEL